MSDRTDVQSDAGAAVETAEPAAPARPATGPADQAVDRTLKFFQAAAADALPGGADELVVRRIIVARRRWDELVEIADVLRGRGVPTNPSEIAAIVIEAGLLHVRDIATDAPRPTLPKRTAPAAPAAANAAPAAPPAPASASPSPGAGPQEGLGLPGAEAGELERLVRGRTSQRSVQRALGLWLGARSAGGDVATEPLRVLCKRFQVYNIANFAQNMKKDAACFAEVKDEHGARIGWRLTPEGQTRAGVLLRTPSVEVGVG